MSIRRIQYQIDYVHIITFREEYKIAVAPYFGFDKLEYGIDNENTIHEGIRLIFKTEQIALILRKDAITLIYEGDVEELKKQNGVIKLFWDLYEKIKSFQAYVKTTRHSLLVHAVKIKDKKEVEEMLLKNPYLSLNPFGKLDEFSCVYEVKKEEVDYKMQFGNYTEKDIKKHDLTPLKTSFNEDLINGLGIMGRLDITEMEKNPNFTKFKSLLTKAENTLALFNLLEEDEK